MATTHIDLHYTPIKRCFKHYLLPAITGLIIKSLFIMGDTIMIGRGTGPDGLGAVALTIPFFSFFTAIAMMLGIGGSAMMAIQFGKGRFEEGQTLFVQSLLLTLILAGGLSMAGLYWLDEMLALMGAQGNTAALTGDFLSIMLQFFIIYALGWVLSCFIRNDGNPRLAMYAMAGSALLNLVLDYFFIFHFGWGIKGAAYATGIAQSLMLLFLLTHFFNPRSKLKLSLRGLGLSKAPKILSIGLPIFFIESSMAATTLIYNVVLLDLGGELYLNAFSIVMNVGIFVMFILVGIGQACQPIISFNHGAESVERVRETLFIGLRFAVITGVVAVILSQLFSKQISGLFTVDNPELVMLSASALVFYFLAFPFMAINLVTATMFQSIGSPANANIISLCRGFLFVVIGLFALPKVLPESGVWLSPLFAETLAALISVVLLARLLKQMKNQTPAVVEQT
ncbi:MATE family efflux transporter [Photobacterium sanctipauli]|uniref:Multidrug export protein MepA n=1 Tax=Photobacterium sanctipauli TaxID=1342794 RepID=A0A2T3NW76_9GAMM|nr:MATE family efflux transporter [Photobacterium sanctipauli]PSW20471.1 MATE family efflux transporter [Photobacterium sanctipauli]